MPKQPKIRITKQDKIRLQKLNKSVSNKKSRIRKKFGVELQIKTRPVKSFKTRKELNEYVKNAETFIDRNNFRFVKNEHGLVFKREEVQHAKNMVKELNQEKKRMLKKVENRMFTSGGRQTQMTVKERRRINDVRWGDLRELKFNINRFRNKKDWNSYISGLEKGISNNLNQQLQKNYIKSLETVFGSDADVFVNEISNMSPEDFALLFYTEDIIDINQYNYNPVISRETKLYKLANVLGMELPDEPYDE